MDVSINTLAVSTLDILLKRGRELRLTPRATVEIFIGLIAYQLEFKGFYSAAHRLGDTILEMHRDWAKYVPIQPYIDKYGSAAAQSQRGIGLSATITGEPGAWRVLPSEQCALRSAEWLIAHLLEIHDGWIVATYLEALKSLLVSLDKDTNYWTFQHSVQKFLQGLEP